MGKIKMIDKVPHVMSKNSIFVLPNYSSHDYGYSWRIIANWEFTRELDRIKFSGLYDGKKNYYSIAELIKGEITIDNPRHVKYPKYVTAILKDMLNQQKN